MRIPNGAYKYALVLLLSTLCAGQSGDSVYVDGGLVRGTTSPSGIAFLGIPYAAPPLGKLRWRAPAPVEPWRGARLADRMPTKCAQLTGFLGAPRLVGQEDCLYLNVWVPPRGGAKLPVLFFIHGGGLIGGSTSDAFIQGSRLAERGNVIVVTMEYRLGILGYLAHPSLSAETDYGGSGNYGLMDQVSALGWVQRNISAFGGDPANVTIFGESSGATSVCALVASPRTRGLFARAIMESSACLSQPKAEAEQEGVANAAKAGCPGTGPEVAECLRNRPLESVVLFPPSELLTKQDFRRTSSLITVDGEWLPESPYRLIRKGKGQAVPLIVGNNAHEGFFFVPVYFNAEQLAAQMASLFGPLSTARIYARYPSGAYSDETERAQAIFADAMFECGIRRLARYRAEGTSEPVFRYVNNYRIRVLGRPLPAAHVLELPFVFQNMADLKGPFVSEEEREMETLFLNYWTQFARTGNPNSIATPNWEAYRAEADNAHVIDSVSYVELGRHADKCDAWEEFLPE